MSANPSPVVPLCVDLDGTLARTDFLLESLLSLLKRKPWSVFLLPFWLLQGKAHLKSEIARRVDFHDAEFPLEQSIVDFIKAEKTSRQIVLVTGSHQSLADVVAEKTGLFDVVRGSDSKVNLTGTRKRDWLVSEYGEGGFDYIGNDKADLEVWPSAREALVVSAPGGIAEHRDITFAKVFDRPKVTFRNILSLLRVHQWSKNALILVPYFLDQRMGDISATGTIIVAFLAMSLLASMTYIANDMLDLQSDRRNATKSKRMLPSGAVPLSTGFIAMAVLALGVLLLSFWLPLIFNLVLLSYLVLTLLYSFVLKSHAMIDVCMIAGLHTLRVVGGTVALQAEWSFWLLAFSMFIFFSLAVAKRVAELTNLQKEGRETTLGRDYHIKDIPVLLATGLSTAYLSVLVVALYINSDKVQRMYDRPELLWLVCPVLMYWVGRVWLKTARGEMHEDPIVFAMRDRVSLYIFTALVFLLLIAWVA